MRSPRGLFLAATATFILSLGASWPGAQSPIDRFRDILGTASIARVIEGDPPVTTNLDRALTEVEVLDRFESTSLTPLRVQAQDADGVFHVPPGAYEFTAESYCLHAGTHGPGGGDGYLYAPLEGSRRETVRAILQRAVPHREIPQQDIQVLLWAILARTPFDEMPRAVQLTAARLLTPAQILEMGGGAIGMVQTRARREASRSMPPAMRRVLDAEVRLRELLAGADAAYSDLERAAVLTGDPEPDGRSRDVPRGRWSYHPDGYFIRFVPASYSRTDIHVFVPDATAIVRDAAGRITAISDPRERLEAAEPPGPVGFRFGSRAVSPGGGSADAATARPNPRPMPVQLTRVDLSEVVAVPGERGRQRLGLSARAAR